MKQEPKYKKLPDGRVARVIHSCADDYTDWFAYIRLKTNLEKRKVAYELVDLLGEDIYSDTLNEVINYLEVLYLREKKQVRRIKNE